MRNSYLFLTFYVAFSLIVSVGNAEEMREPASSLETKKDIANQGFPQSEEPPTRLFNGEWRDQWSQSGFDFEAFYFWNGVSTQNGGLEQGALGFSNFDVMMHFDFEKIMGWTGGSFHLHHHTHGGESPAVYVGDAMGVNSYSPPYENDSFLSQAYLQQTWGEGAWDALLGLYDFSSEFMVTDSSLIFLNNGFLLGLEAYPPSPAELSVYPVNGPALRLKWVYEKVAYLMAGVSSAVARDPNYTNGTHPRMGTDEGYYQIVEAGWQQEFETDVFNKIAIGAWNFSNDFDKIDGSGKGKYTGLYFLSDYHVNSSLALFVRYGMANKEVGTVSTSMAAGVNYTGVFTDKDQIGFGGAQSNLSSVEMDRLTASGDDPAANEQAYEIVYRNEIKPGIVITPDLQWIKTPSMSKATKDATVASLRVELSF